jgi:hypothetical protein
MQSKLFDQNQLEKQPLVPIKAEPRVPTLVGTSDRTPMKHAILNKMLGIEAGVCSIPRHAGSRAMWVDLCAGDGGQDRDGGIASSPEIFIKHAAFILEHATRFDLNLFFIEKHGQTHERLASNLEDHINLYVNPAGHSYEIMREITDTGHSVKFVNKRTRTELYIETLNDDARTVDLLSYPLRSKDFAFINNDPNNVNDFALDPAQYGKLADNHVRVTQYSTLGCNPSGLKRLPYEQRAGWYDNIVKTINSRPRHHMPIMFAFGKDDSRWGYLINTAERFHEDTVKNIEKVYKKASDSGQLKHYDLLMAKTNEGFLELIEYLVFTVDELTKDGYLNMKEIYAQLHDKYGVK